MMISVTIRDQLMARAPEPSLVLSWRDGVPMRLSDLIRERVMMEWDRREDQARFAGRPLVERPSNALSPTGCEQAVAVALDGFGRNAFFVTVDDRQVTELDAEIRITAATSITFIRLTPLVSG